MYVCIYLYMYIYRGNYFTPFIKRSRGPILICLAPHPFESSQLPYPGASPSGAENVNMADIAACYISAYINYMVLLNMSSI